MTDYDFRDNFAAAPDGPFTTANKKLAWPDSVYTLNDPDPEGQFFSIVSDSRFANGKACRMRYPAGSWGMHQQYYQLRVASPQTIANLEFSWLFEENFDLWPPNPEKAGGGKIGPCINWGEVGGETSKRGTRCMWWYNGNGSLYQAGKWSPICQDQRSGDPKIKPSQYSPDVIKVETLYKFRVQVMGGPDGFANYWYNDQPLASSVPGLLQVTPQDDVLFDFAFFAGGGENQACRWDSFARHGSIHCWSGKDQPQPGPTPDKQYKIEGTVTLTPIT
jgi:hypothetical protein